MHFCKATKLSPAVRTQNHRKRLSELRDIVQNGHLLAGLERWKADIRTVSAAECIAECAAAATACLALHGKVQLVQVLALELERAEILIGFGAAGLVFGLEAFG